VASGNVPVPRSRVYKKMKKRNREHSGMRTSTRLVISNTGSEENMGMCGDELGGRKVCSWGSATRKMVRGGSAGKIKSQLSSQATSGAP